MTRAAPGAVAAVAAMALLAAALLGGCAGAPARHAGEPLAGERDAALDALLAMRDAEGRWPAGQVPYVAEAAAAAGKDLRAWPEPVPLAEQVAWPAEGGSLLPALRPLHAVALAHAGDGAELARVRDRVLAGLRDGQFGEPDLLNDDAFALVVLGAAGAAQGAEPVAAARSLLANQSADGGWSWSAGGAGETDMTGLVLAGVAEAGLLAEADADAARAFLAAARSPDGGYAQQPGGRGNCDSTVWGIRALALLGEPAPRDEWEFLLGLQRGDGSFAYLPGGPSNALCTAEAATLLGMAAAGGVPLPAGVG